MQIERTYRFYNTEHQAKFNELLAMRPVVKRDKYWKITAYLVSHPDLWERVNNNLDDCYSKLEAEDLGSGLHGLVKLGYHLFTGGSQPFVLDDYLYTWDGDNFEVAMELIRIAKKG